MSDFSIDLTSVTHGFDGETCWVDPWAGHCPEQGSVVLTMQRLDLSGSDVFFGACHAQSADLGKTWTPLCPVPVMQRVSVGDGLEGCVNDLKPQWHNASQTMLGIGIRVYYRENAKGPDHTTPGGRPPETVYSVFNCESATWSAPQNLQFRDPAHPYKTVAGSVQRFDREDGTILLPLSCSGPGEAVRSTIVGRCDFDGRDLSVVEMGNPLRIPVDRGLYEPSLTRLGARYFLTIRNDQCGYVSVSNDGLHFTEPREWCFDDGQPLGSYNTQQHWVTHGDRLYLVYTRRGLDNDHVFRHRAPLMIAEVDPDALVVLRATETELVPNRGARLGNFSICEVGPQETWVLVAEWMQPRGCEQYGSDNTVWIARLIWP